jgi:hypothetical protein
LIEFLWNCRLYANICVSIAIKYYLGIDILRSIICWIQREISYSIESNWLRIIPTDSRNVDSFILLIIETQLTFAPLVWYSLLKECESLNVMRNIFPKTFDNVQIENLLNNVDPKSVLKLCTKFIVPNRSFKLIDLWVKSKGMMKTTLRFYLCCVRPIDWLIESTEPFFRFFNRLMYTFESEHDRNKHKQNNYFKAIPSAFQDQKNCRYDGSKLKHWPEYTCLKISSICLIIAYRELFLNCEDKRLICFETC